MAKRARCGDNDRTSRAKSHFCAGKETKRCNVKAKRANGEGGKACGETQRLTDTSEGSERPTLGVPVHTS